MGEKSAWKGLKRELGGEEMDTASVNNSLRFFVKQKKKNNVKAGAE